MGNICTQTTTAIYLAWFTFGGTVWEGLANVALHVTGSGTPVLGNFSSPSLSLLSFLCVSFSVSVSLWNVVCTLSYAPGSGLPSYSHIPFHGAHGV